MAEPHLQKKLKVKDNEIQFFEDFLENEKNESLTSILRAILSELKVGLAHSSVFFLRVKASNANSYTDFQKATIDAEVHRRGSVSVGAPIALFYLRGYATLIDFLDTPDAKIPEDIVERRALRELLQFLIDTNEHSVFTENRDRGKEEKEWADAVRFAQHLLVPIIVSQKTFVIDSYPGLQPDRCCSVGHPVNGVIGDTSFAVQSVLCEYQP